MKALFIVAIALVSTSAFAGTKVTNSPCSQEGVTQLVQGGYTQDGYVPETFRTCSNGVWVLNGPGVQPAPDYTKRLNCSVEGLTQKVQGGYEQDGYVPEIFRTCVNGKWILSGPGHKAAPDYSKIKCKEGVVYTEYSRDNGNSTFQCIGGKFRKIY